MPGDHLAREIAEQPAVLAGLLAAERGRAEEIAAALRTREIAFVTIAARGTSDNAARYAQYLFGARNHLPVALATPALFTLYGAPPDLRRGLVVGVSQSGESPDILAVLAEGRRQGAPTLALTNFPDSPLGRAAEFVLPLRAGPERSVAATKTYTAQLLALAMLSAALEGAAGR
jgi:glucosamine--fructose-6-phosphate aminotransferase (isomerizing)